MEAEAETVAVAVSRGGSGDGDGVRFALVGQSSPPTRERVGTRYKIDSLAPLPGWPGEAYGCALAPRSSNQRGLAGRRV